MFELLCFFGMVLGCCDLVLAKVREQDALAPPLLMGSKEFYLESRSEGRQVSFNFYERMDDIERMVENLHNIRISKITELNILQDVMDFSEATKQLIEELEANNLDEDTVKRCLVAENKIRIFDDRLALRLEQLSRSEARIKSSS